MNQHLARLVATTGLLLACCSATPAADMQGVLQLIDYVGVDYPQAVSGGEIINDLEYGEMQEFSKRIAAAFAGPEPAAADLIMLSEQLVTAVARKSDAAAIAQLTQQMRRAILDHYDVALTPNQAPDLSRARALYAEQCAGCHGAGGNGDGPAATGLDPPPTNFRDPDRARQRSLFGLFNTITLGVDGTAMIGFNTLSQADRWSLAFYVGALSFDGMKPKDIEAAPAISLTLKDAVTLSPVEMGERHAQGEAAAFRLRQDPSLLFGAPATPLDVAVQKLDNSVARYRKGDTEGAERDALAAYLDGVELSEAALRNVSSELTRDLERSMLDYRQAVSRGASIEEVESAFAVAQRLIGDAQRALSGTALSGGAAFTSSLIILLREGLEAILVLAAMVAYLIRAGRRDALIYVHSGWIAALIAGIATWILSEYAFTISGATREVTEGAATLAAAAILFYVGFWMHRNASMSRWSRYLHGKLQAALSRQALWTLCLVSFLAVYREVFETILFYQALWLQVTTQAHAAVFAGGAIAAVLLVISVWLISRSGMRLPMRQFFLASAALMIILAIVFAGRGIGSLQEAGRIPVWPLDVPGIEYFGIQPSMQAAGLQLLLLVLAVGLVLYERRGKRSA